MVSVRVDDVALSLQSVISGVLHALEFSSLYQIVRGVFNSSNCGHLLVDVSDWCQVWNMTLNKYKINGL